MGVCFIFKSWNFGSFVYLLNIFVVSITFMFLKQVV